MGVLVSLRIWVLGRDDADDLQNPVADPANVVQALVYTLLDVFDAARDLHQTLRHKEERDLELRLRSKGYPQSRRIEYVEDDELSTDEGIVLDKAAVTRQFENGFQDIGGQFAIGDGMEYILSAQSWKRSEAYIPSLFTDCTSVPNHNAAVSYHNDFSIRTNFA
jgi:hypothetical protein